MTECNWLRKLEGQVNLVMHRNADCYDPLDNSEGQVRPGSIDLVLLKNLGIADSADMSLLPVKPVFNTKLGYPRKFPGIGGDHGEVL